MAALLAGLPVEMPGATVNRLCGSGMEAVSDAARAIAAGDADICVAGGSESMTRAPFVRPAQRRRLGALARDRRHPARLAAGEPAACRSSTRRSAWARRPRTWPTSTASPATGRTRSRSAAISWPPPPGTRAGSRPNSSRSRTAGGEVTSDEGIKASITLEELAGKRPAFRKGGTVTGGNSSPLNDGAAALLLMSEEAVRRPASPRWPGTSARRRPGAPRLHGDRPGARDEPGGSAGPAGGSRTSTWWS